MRELSTNFTRLVFLFEASFVARAKANTAEFLANDLQRKDIRKSANAIEDFADTASDAVVVAEDLIMKMQAGKIRVTKARLEKVRKLLDNARWACDEVEKRYRALKIRYFKLR